MSWNPASPILKNLTIVWQQLKSSSKNQSVEALFEWRMQELEAKIKAINIPIVGSLAMFRSLMRANTHLRSLLHLHSDNQPSAAIDCVNICKMFKILRVLDLRGINSQQDLKIFAVWDIWSWIFLPFPSSLCNPLNLYTLDMLSSFIDCVPVEFWTVHELMPLNSGYITLPPHPGKYCRSLENINFISALTYDPSCCTPDILGRLPNLEHLRTHRDLSYYQPALSLGLAFSGRVVSNPWSCSSQQGFQFHLELSINPIRLHFRWSVPHKSVLIIDAGRCLVSGICYK